MIIPELKVGMNETLDKVLQNVASQVSTTEAPVIVEFEKEGLSDLRLPKFQMRQVSLDFLFLTIGHLSGAKVKFSEGKILVLAEQKSEFSDCLLYTSPSPRD